MNMSQPFPNCKWKREMNDLVLFQFSVQFPQFVVDAALGTSL
jgi:hypothetical protein